MIFELNELPKTKTHPNSFQQNFHNILQRHPGHLYVFTNDSKENDKTAYAAVLDKTIIKKALPTESSIFTAEACAVDLALDIISKSKQEFYYILRFALDLTLIKQ